VRIALLRPVPEEGVVSMERYADGLERALRTRDDVDVEPVVVHQQRGLPLPKLSEYRARYVAYPRAVRQAHADVFHVTDHSYAHLVRAAPSGHAVVTCHDLALLRADRDDLGFTASAFTRKGFQLIARSLPRAAHVICDSEATRRDAIELAGVDPERATVVPPGLDPSWQNIPKGERERVRRKLGLDGPVVLHVDSGALYKNSKGVIETFALVRGDIPDATLLRVGAPLSEPVVARANALGIDAAVRDLGRVSENQLHEAYAAADVLLFPSYFEGFGWPVLEAMASGVPVVCSTAPALAELAGDSALTADAIDHASLAKAVVSVLNSSEERARLCERGLERARTFTWSRSADEIVAVYGRVAASRG
jgi:glycosyltransferase involved in cell wall biosynthesis